MQLVRQGSENERRPHQDRPTHSEPFMPSQELGNGIVNYQGRGKKHNRKKYIYAAQYVGMKEGRADNSVWWRGGEAP